MDGQRRRKCRRSRLRRIAFIDSWICIRNCTTIETQRSFLSSRQASISSPGKEDLFKRVYRHTFIIARSGNARGLSVEEATTYWDLLFKPPGLSWTSDDSPWLDWWKEFVEHKHRKTITKDMWNETLRMVSHITEDPTLSWWTEDSAWPSAIDEFVAYVKTEKRGETASAEGMEVEY
jgi:DCN1-like protein 1/2